MSKKHKEGILPFTVVATDEPLIARAIKLPQLIDRELPPPGSGRAPDSIRG
jgi:hypothetical protein